MLELIEKANKNPFILEEPYQNLLQNTNNNRGVQLALVTNLGSSLGTFLRTFLQEVLNIGVTFETFLDTTLKNENAGDLVEYYQSVKEMLEEVAKLNESLV